VPQPFTQYEPTLVNGLSCETEVAASLSLGFARCAYVASDRSAAAGAGTAFSNSQEFGTSRWQLRFAFYIDTSAYERRAEWRPLGLATGASRGDRY
jgi:hypothetical protein